MRISPFASMTLPLALAATLLAGGCSKQAPQQTANPQETPQQNPNAPAQQAVNPGNSAPVQQPPLQPAAPGQTASGQTASGRAGSYAGAPARSEAPPAPPVPVTYTIPAGTRISVTTRETISTKTSEPGQTFTATVALPVSVRGATLVRAGSSAGGTVIDSKSPGRFKGEGTLAVRLDSLTVDGRSYEISTSAYTKVVKGKGKRTAVLAGGGGGLGALIGGLAGGGKGALIGGLAGAGAGTAGAAYTGNKELEIPAESRVTFRLARAVTVRR